MGESASARTQRELADLRAAIDRDVDALLARARKDVDPRNLLRRQPLAVGGSLVSVATGAAVALWRRARKQGKVEATLDVLLDRFGTRIDKMKGTARKEFRKQLRKELAEVERTGPKEAAYGAVAGAVTAMATTLATGFARRLLGDEREEPRSR